MDKRLFLRIIIDIILVISVIHGLWIIIIPIGIAGLWIFPSFIEIILIGLVYDLLFSPIYSTDIRGYLGMICTIILFIALFGFKHILRR